LINGREFNKPGVSRQAEEEERQMSKIQEKWAGLVSLERKRGLFVGSAGYTATHVPHAVKICFAVESGDKFYFRVGAAGEWISCEAAIIAPDQPHQIDGCGKNLALFYLMPETAEAQKVLEKYLNHNRGFALISRVAVADLSVRLSSVLNRWCCTRDEAFDLGNHLIHSLKLSPSVSWRESLDKRVERAVEYIESKVEDKIFVKDIAKIAWSSAGMLAHVFKDETQIAVHQYQLWLKLRAAIKCMSFSKNLDYIANAAGFFDQSHINKHFLKMHGILPSALLRHSKIINNDDA